MTRYTVIGARGVVGTHMVAHLRAAGIEPFCPVRDDPSLWDRDLGRIVYCAGLTGDYRGRPFAAVEAHVSLLARLLERAEFERIVYLSSTRVYDSEPDLPGREDRPIAVDAANAEHLQELSKLLGENLTLNRAGGRGVVARLSYVFGWEEPAEGFLSDWLRRARDDKHLRLDSSPGYGRDYIHVDDAVRALRMLVDGATTQIANVAGGRTLSNAEVAAVFERQGWKIDFAHAAPGQDRRPIETDRLAAAGFVARPVLPLIETYLASLPGAA